MTRVLNFRRLEASTAANEDTAAPPDLLENVGPHPAALFDYGQMDAGAARDAKAIVETYRSRNRAFVIDTGRDLLAIKQRLDHGLFEAWVEAELWLTPRSAQNYMRAAIEFGDKSEIVSVLPPTTLYALASPSTPAQVREDVVRRLAAKEPLPTKVISQMIVEAKEESRKKAAEEKEAARRAPLTEEQRVAENKRNQSRAARRKAETERFYNKQQARDRVEKAAVEDAAQLVAEALGESLPRLLKLAEDAASRKVEIFARAGTLAPSVKPTVTRVDDRAATLDIAFKKAGVVGVFDELVERFGVKAMRARLESLK